MARLAWLAIFVGVSIGAPGVDGAERIVKKDGSTVTGDVVGFQNGSYTVRVGESLVDVPALEVHTIEEFSAPADATPTVKSEGGLDTELLLERLTLRPQPPEGAEHRRLFQDAVAAVLRGDWDFALTTLERLRQREPGWADHQILTGWILSERGAIPEALRVARRLELVFEDDVLAQEVTAEIYRRSGLPRRYAAVRERVIRSRANGARLPYELAHLWWSVDRSRAESHWNRYRELDPRLTQPWCREGHTLRQIKVALSTEDWSGAQAHVGELVRRFPWMDEQLLALRVEILESRLRTAESRGRLEEASLVFESLRELEPGRLEEWNGREAGLRSFVLGRGLILESYDELERWFRDNEPVLGPGPGSWRARIATRFQELALGALARGNVEEARLAFRDAHGCGSEARPAELGALLEPALDRIGEDLNVGRRARALTAAGLLRHAFPERQEELLERLTGVYRGSLASSHTPEELQQSLGQLRAVFEESTIPTDGVTEVPEVAVTSEPTSTPEVFDPVAAWKALRLHFPHTPGTRWVYRRGDGKREERRVVSLTPHGDTGWRVSIRVSVEGEGELLTDAYLAGRDLILNHPSVPPGEIALRYPFRAGARWNWSRDSFEYERRIYRPADPVPVPGGAVAEVVVVEAENRIATVSGDKTYRVRTRVTYAAGLGVIKVESENPTIARTLLEFEPGAELIDNPFGAPTK